MYTVLVMQGDEPWRFDKSIMITGITYHIYLVVEEQAHTVLKNHNVIMNARILARTRTSKSQRY